jgi:membrane-bound lytic murein transglycosylase MltF
MEIAKRRGSRVCSIVPVVLTVAAFLAIGCSSQTPAGEAPPPADQPTAEPLSPAETSDAPPAADAVVRRWTGDLDGMIERRLVRVLVPYSKTQFFIDHGTQRGLAYEAGKKFEDELNKRLKTGNLRIQVLFIPMSRDELFPALLEGRGDVVAAALTVTPERLKTVAFGPPTRKDVSEIVVTSTDAPPIASVDDLSGREVFVRRSSSYYESLQALNQRFASAGKKPVVLKDAPETLEDEDLLEMANAGLVKTLIVDDYLAEFWKQIFTSIVLHPDVSVRTGGVIAPAIRPNSPKLEAALADFQKRFGAGTTFGNVVLQRYLKETKYAKNATAASEMARLESVIALFRKYGGQYDLDWLLMAAQSYQESGLDQQKKSPVGAIGIMQVMPATGKELNVGDIAKLEPNIHAGVKYIRFMIDRYYANEPMDRLNRGLFAFASYNAGPARIRQLRTKAAERGLNPNVWFNNVERIASEEIGRETVQYVSNIYKYYVAYQLAIREVEERRQVKGTQG